MRTVKRALLVDDNKSLLSLMGLLLEGVGYQVQSFESPIPAIFHAMSERYDILISDVCMPQIKGQELISKVRQSPLNQNIPTLLISGHPDSEIEELHAIPNMHFIRKPFSCDGFLDTVERLIQSTSVQSDLTQASSALQIPLSQIRYT